MKIFINIVRVSFCLFIINGYAQVKHDLFLLEKDRVLNLASKYKLPKKDFPFAPSGIAIHPISKNIYIIASKGKTLCVFSPKGDILHLQNLDAEIYTQPEGIMFFENGDMMIASEGEEFGRLVRVNYLKKK